MPETVLLPLPIPPVRPKTRTNSHSRVPGNCHRHYINKRSLPEPRRVRTDSDASTRAETARGWDRVPSPRRLCACPYWKLLAEVLSWKKATICVVALIATSKIPTWPGERFGGTEETVVTWIVSRWVPRKVAVTLTPLPV